jgi:hypothetical protein
MSSGWITELGKQRRWPAERGALSNGSSVPLLRHRHFKPASCRDWQSGEGWRWGRVGGCRCRRSESEAKTDRSLQLGMPPFALPMLPHRSRVASADACEKNAGGRRNDGWRNRSSLGRLLKSNNLRREENCKWAATTVPSGTTEKCADHGKNYAKSVPHPVCHW